MPTQAEAKLSSAKTNIIIHSPFFGFLLLQMKMERDDSVGTMATDGQKVLYNEAFVLSLSNPEVRGVLVHEAAHIFMKHHFRIKNRNPKKFNIAADLAINPLVKEWGYTLPEGHLDEYKYHGMSAEEIYALLPDNKSAGNDIGGVLPAVGPDGGLATEVDESIFDSSVIMAANAAKKAGKLPAGLERLIGDILEPKADWETILAVFVDSMAQSDYSFRKLDRGMLQRGIIGPGLQSEEIGDALIVLDLSGSIGGDEVKEQLGEVFGILDRYDVNLTLATADTEVYMVGQWERGDIPDPSQLVLRGGGGTSLARLNEWVAENSIRPRFAIYFTDGYLSEWGEPTPFPLLTCILTGGSTHAVPDWTQIVNIN